PATPRVPKRTLSWWSEPEFAEIRQTITPNLMKKYHSIIGVILPKTGVFALAGLLGLGLLSASGETVIFNETFEDLSNWSGPSNNPEEWDTSERVIEVTEVNSEQYFGEAANSYLRLYKAQTESQSNALTANNVFSEPSPVVTISFDLWDNPEVGAGSGATMRTSSAVGVTGSRRFHEVTFHQGTLAGIVGAYSTGEKHRVQLVLNNSTEEISYLDDEYAVASDTFDIWVAEQLAAGAPRPPQWAGLKFFNVYGPNEYHKGPQASVVWHLFRQLQAGDTVRLFQSHNPAYPDGGQLRDFVWVGDCVAAMLWLLEHPKAGGLLNLGSGRARSFNDLAAALFAALGRAGRIDYVPTPESLRAGYQYFTEARMERLREIGYPRALASLEEGVARYVQDYLQQDDPYR
ncbi:MAG: NAD-dependent epimerase/dehydratase family protein, partial [Rhodovibrionaceae bacterium]